MEEKQLMDEERELRLDKDCIISRAEPDQFEKQLMERRERLSREREEKQLMDEGRELRQFEKQLRESRERLSPESEEKHREEEKLEIMNECRLYRERLERHERLFRESQEKHLEVSVEKQKSKSVEEEEEDDVVKRKSKSAKKKEKDVKLKVGESDKTWVKRIRRLLAKDLKERLKSDENYVEKVAKNREKNREKLYSVYEYNHEVMKAEQEMENRYNEAVWKSDGFDLEDVEVETPDEGALESLYSTREDDYSKHIILYAKLGIHRYNILEGKNLHFSSMVKYNYLYQGCDSCSNFITCIAKDPHAGSLQLFQSGVVELDLHNDNDEMIVSCFIARLKSSAEKQPEKPVEKPEERKPVEYSALPKWPSSENDFKDKSRYYLLKTSEVREYDWIRLYLELAFTKANTKLGSPDLTKLVITKVAVTTGETQDPLKERLEIGNATFYIKYKYCPKNCKFSRDRIAVIRRTINKKTGCFTLMFNNGYVNTLL